MNDLETARRIAEGDPATAEAFVRETYPAVFRLLRHLTAHREDAEDLAQQAFLTARVQMHSFRGQSSLRTWLHRIAYNEYLQWKRKRRQTVRLVADQAVTERGFGSFLDGESVLSALAQLPDKQREAFVLHEIEEISVLDVARILKVPVGTVKARLHYARHRLRVLLEDGTEEMENEPSQVTV